MITGITGQDGAYLSRLLLDKNYIVHGLQRRASSSNTARLSSLLSKGDGQDRLHMHYGDLTDSSNVIRLVNQIKPDEIYNLGAMSHVHVSFETPEYTADTNAIGCLRLLEAIRICGLETKTRFYQASSSELYGDITARHGQTQTLKQNEQTPFNPCSPYAAAKQYAHAITLNYRRAYGIYAVNGILFNHESPLRGEEFVTRKITLAVAQIRRAMDAGETPRPLRLGNLEAQRDWGYAGDYVKAMWMMLQQGTPDDFVIASGETRTVRDFAERAYASAGITLVWGGAKNTPHEYGYDHDTKQKLVEIDPQFFRPSDVSYLCGDASKAAQKLGWKPQTSFDELVQMMVAADVNAACTND